MAPLPRRSRCVLKMLCRFCHHFAFLPRGLPLCPRPKHSAGNTAAAVVVGQKVQITSFIHSLSVSHILGPCCYCMSTVHEGERVAYKRAGGVSSGHHEALLHGRHVIWLHLA